MPDVAKKRRIFQIAKELNISHLEIMQFLESNGIPVNSHMAPVMPEVYDEILLEFSKDKLQIERHRKEQARKIVVSKIQLKQSEEDESVSEKAVQMKSVRKLKTSLKDEKLALSDKLKDASDTSKPGERSYSFISSAALPITNILVPSVLNTICRG